MSQTKRPRAPGYTYGALSVAVVLLVGVVAVSVAQPPAPTIAEFAPRSLEQITEAPDEQASGEGTAVRPAPTPSPPPDEGPLGGGEPPVELPRVNDCVGDPPRQIEDPQSPPCVPYWDGDNGGATYAQGVTGTEIIVAWPVSIERTADVQTLAAFFNSRFEFYGRRITLRPLSPSGGALGPTDPAKMNADAVLVDERLGAFASLMYPPRDGAEHHYYDELARRGVLSVDARQSLRDAEHFASRAPFQWAVEPPWDVMSRAFGAWYCATLAGRDAVHGGNAVQDRERALAVLRATNEDGSSPDTAPLKAALRRCGVVPAYEGELNADTDDLSDGTNAVVAMRERATSVVCLCSAGQLQSKLMPAATVQGYEPEWLLDAFQFQDRETAATQWPQEQAVHAFGIAFRNKWLRNEDMPWFWAMRAANPTWQPPPDQGWNQALLERYAELLLLSSGIQLAGPDLTPETFAAGLRRARFPNPGCAAPPYHQACVGFSGGSDFFFHDDATQIWWNPTERNYSANNPQGAFCYVSSGARYPFTRWPGDDQPFFTGRCR